MNIFDKLIPGLNEAKQRAIEKAERQNALNYLLPIGDPIEKDERGYLKGVQPGQMIAKIDSVNHIVAFPFNGQGPTGTNLLDPEEGKFFLAKPMPGGFGLESEMALTSRYLANGRSIVGPLTEVFAIHDEDFINRVNNVIQSSE